MGHTLNAILISAGLLAGILTCVEIGRRIAARSAARAAAAGNGDTPGIGSIDASIFGLMGLLLAFAFSGALSRWEDSRQYIAREANAIGTAWLRLDLAQQAVQPKL